MKCRGCGGTGIKHGAPARLLQAAKIAIEVAGWTDEVTGRHRRRVIPGISADFCLNDWLAKWNQLAAVGAPLPEPVLSRGDRCDWCWGSGEKALSAQTLEAMVDA